MTLTYRGAGAWGAGKGARLTAAEFDGNTYDLDQRIQDLEGGFGGSGTSNPLVDIAVSGATITKYFADSTTGTEVVTAPFASPYLEITTTTYTVLAEHIGYFLEFTNVSGCTITVPTGLAGATNVEWHFCQGDACPSLTITTSGTTVSGVYGLDNATDTPGAVVTLKRKATNAFRLFGLLAVTGSA